MHMIPKTGRGEPPPGLAQEFARSLMPMGNPGPSHPPHQNASIEMGDRTDSKALGTYR